MIHLLKAGMDEWYMMDFLYKKYAAEANPCGHHYHMLIDHIELHHHNWWVLIMLVSAPTLTASILRRNNWMMLLPIR